MQQALDIRVKPGIFRPEAVRLAAVYSGGVLRSFFGLLRAGIDVADENEMTTVDELVMRAAIKAARLNESQPLHKKNYETLAEVHRTNFLPEGNAKCLEQSWVLECFNDKLWYEANPLMWKLLDPSHK